MAITTREAARILVHYIELALGDQMKGDMRAELGSVVDAFDALDQERQRDRTYLDRHTPMTNFRR